MYFSHVATPNINVKKFRLEATNRLVFVRNRLQSFNSTRSPKVTIKLSRIGKVYKKTYITVSTVAVSSEVRKRNYLSTTPISFSQNAASKESISSLCDDLEVATTQPS